MCSDIHVEEQPEDVSNYRFISMGSPGLSERDPPTLDPVTDFYGGFLTEKRKNRFRDDDQPDELLK